MHRFIPIQRFISLPQFRSWARRPVVLGILALVILLPVMAVVTLGATHGILGAPKPIKAQIHKYLPHSKTSAPKKGTAPLGGLPPNPGSLDLNYYGGPVHEHPVSYLVFWGSGWGTLASPSTDVQQIVNYFANMGHTQFENLLTQYYDSNAHISNTQTLGGFYFDPAAPPVDSLCSPGTTVEDSSVVAEVSHAIAAAGWPTDQANATYFVYTPPGTSIGYSDGTNAHCSGLEFCAYHSYTANFGAGVAYAAEPYPTAPAGSGLPDCLYPDTNAASLINSSSHEQFESITDPFPLAEPGFGGWVNPNGADGGEIGDECAYIFPNDTGAGGINPAQTTIMNNNQTFLVQTEYSNATHSCQAYYVPKTVGVYYPANSTFYLRNSNSAGYSDLTVSYGFPGAVPLAGDWTGKGYDSVGIYNPSTATFYLKNTNAAGPADIAFNFGPPNSIPLAGDWNGDGVDSIGVYYPANHTFYLRNSNTPGNANLAFTFGFSGAVPLAGDWSSKGYDSVGVYNPATGTFYLKNSNAGGAADIAFSYGGPNKKPLTGDWAGSFYDGPGVFVPGSATFFLRVTNNGGGADIAFSFGPPNAVPIDGLWVSPGAGPIVS